MTNEPTYRYFSGSGSFSQCILIPQRGVLSCAGPKISLMFRITRGPRTSTTILPTDPPSMEWSARPHRKSFRSRGMSPNPFTSGLSCDCTNSANYALSLLYFNRTAPDNENRSVKVPRVACALQGKVLQVVTKKK